MELGSYRINVGFCGGVSALVRTLCGAKII